MSSKGPSLICLTWPCVPPVTCSTAYLVRLMTPGAACHSAFTVTSFISSLDVPASEACPISFSLASFKFFFSLVFVGDSEESFLWPPLMGIGWGESLCMKGNVIPEPFLDRTALLICLPAVSCFMRSCIFPLPLGYCFLRPKQKSRKARERPHTWMEWVLIHFL